MLSVIRETRLWNECKQKLYEQQNYQNGEVNGNIFH